MSVITFSILLSVSVAVVIFIILRRHFCRVKVQGISLRSDDAHVVEGQVVPTSISIIESMNNNNNNDNDNNNEVSSIASADMERGNIVTQHIRREPFGLINDNDIDHHLNSNNNNNNNNNNENGSSRNYQCIPSRILSRLRQMLTPSNSNNNNNNNNNISSTNFEYDPLGYNRLEPQPYCTTLEEYAAAVSKAGGGNNIVYMNNNNNNNNNNNRADDPSTSVFNFSSNKESQEVGGTILFAEPFYELCTKCPATIPPHHCHHDENNNNNNNNSNNRGAKVQSSVVVIVVSQECRN